ncbi:MAG: type II secretion system protein GspM [Nitrospirota bacterium]
MKRLWQRFSKREKGFLALTLVIFLLVLGRYFLVSPLLERRVWVESQIEIQSQILERDLRYISQKEEIQAVLEKARGGLKELESLLLSGDTPSVSASELQDLVGVITVKEGAKVITMRVLNPDAIGSYTKIPIQVEATGDIGQIVNLMKGIQSAEKLLIVNELNLLPLYAPLAASRQQAGQNIPAQNLRANLIISGFSWSKTAMPSNRGPQSTKTRSDGGMKDS